MVLDKQIINIKIAVGKQKPLNNKGSFLSVWHYHPVK